MTYNERMIIMKVFKKNIVIVLTFALLFQFTLGVCLWKNTSTVSALEQEVTIDNSTLNEFLEYSAPEFYSTLSEQEKELASRINTNEILGNDAPDEVKITYSPKTRTIVWAPSAIVLTQARYNRLDSKQVTFGGVFSCTKGVKIKGITYLVRTRDDYPVDHISKEKAQTTGFTTNKTVDLRQSSERYSAESIGFYTDNTTGASKITRQKTNAKV